MRDSVPRLAPGGVVALRVLVVLAATAAVVLEPPTVTVVDEGDLER